MSGVEVIGLLAGAGQLVEYGLLFVAFISATYDKIKDAPGALEEHVVQIREILSVTELVKQNSCDPVVHTHIQSIHSEARKLVVVLDRDLEQYKKKPFKIYWLAIKGREQKKISSIFEKLEKAKLGLTLYIVSSNTDCLNSIRISLNKLEHGMSLSTPTTTQAPVPSNQDSSDKESDGERSYHKLQESSKVSAASLQNQVVLRAAGPVADEMGLNQQYPNNQTYQQNQSSPTYCPSQSYRPQHNSGEKVEGGAVPGPANTRPAGFANSFHKMGNVKLKRSNFSNGDQFSGCKNPPIVSTIPNGSSREVGDIDADENCNVFNGHQYINSSWNS